MTEKTTLQKVRELLESAGKHIYRYDGDGPDILECRCCGEEAYAVYKNGYIDHYEKLDHKEGCIFYGE